MELVVNLLQNVYGNKHSKNLFRGIVKEDSYVSNILNGSPYRDKYGVLFANSSAEQKTRYIKLLILTKAFVKMEKFEK